MLKEGMLGNLALLQMFVLTHMSNARNERYAYGLRHECYNVTLLWLTLLTYIYLITRR